MMKSDYSVEQASEETREAMLDRCAEEGHSWVNCCAFLFSVYQRCRWCGEAK